MKPAIADAVPSRLCPQGFQDTGNPVLDSTANIVAAAFSQSRPATAEVEGFIEAVHDAVRKVADEEPGGLIRSGGRLQSDEGAGDEPSEDTEAGDRSVAEKAEFDSDEAERDEAEEIDAEGDESYKPVVEARRKSRSDPSSDELPRRESSRLTDCEEEAGVLPRTAGDAAGRIAEKFVGKAVGKIAGTAAGEAASRAASKAAKRMADRAVSKLAEHAVRKITGDAVRTRPR